MHTESTAGKDPTAWARQIFDTVSKINKEYKENLYCHECGKRFLPKNDRERQNYYSSGMCAECEQAALCEPSKDPVIMYLGEILAEVVKIKETIGDITDMIAKERKDER
jgi:hypothetical protein